MRTCVFSSRLVLPSTALALTALIFGSVAPGCGAESAPSGLALETEVAPQFVTDDGDKPANQQTDLAAALRLAFPDRAADVLDQESRFVRLSAGYWKRWGGLEGARPAVGSFGVMDVFLPEEGADAVRLVLGDGFEVRVREVGAAGPGRSAANATAYARAGGTSFWTAAPTAVEEWLHLQSEYVRSDLPVVEWDIEGGQVQVMEDADRVAIFDEKGVARVWVTAPRAYSATGEAVETSFEVEGNRLSLYADANDEELLVNPRWTNAAPLSVGRCHPATVALPNGHVLAVGGFSFSATWTSVAEVYNPTTNVWSSVGSAYPSVGHRAVLLNDGRVLIAGGFDGSDHLRNAALYNPNTFTWSAAGPMNSPRNSPEMVVMTDGRVLVTGGNNATTDPIASTEVYDPATNIWTYAAPMAYARILHGMVLLEDGRVLVAGGARRNAPSHNIAEIYDPTTNTWSSAGTMNVARSHYTLTMLLNGRALAVGGVSTMSQTATAEVYEPTTNSWTLVGSMFTSRNSHTATRLGDGSVLVAGGYTGAGGMGTSELFDPMTNTWSVPAFMSAPRDSHGAAQVGNKVLVVGGQDMANSCTATTEIFSNGELGDGCTLAADCQGGICADGVCCNSDCGSPGDCQVCNAPGSVGTCILAPAMTVCRPSTGTCDAAEVCDGVGTACPGDLFQPDGVLCDDANPCSLVDSCRGGQCAAGTPVDCRAKDECQFDGACDATTGACVAPPPQTDGTPCTGGTCQTGTCTPDAGSSSSSSSSSSGAGGAGGAGGNATGGSGGTGDSVGEGGSMNPSGAGGNTPTTEGGCNCRLAGQSEGDRATWVLLGAALVMVRRTRRPRRN